MSVGIFVLGAARSGTSTATRVVNLLGVPTTPEEDLKPADEDNPRGYFESRELTAFNRRLLVEVGGAPYGPAPRFPSGWSADPALDGARDEARALVARLLPTAPWVWKDPRTCLTLPFWLDVADIDPIVVLVYRDPLEVADSLVRRDDAPIPVTLGVWERYNRAAVRNAHGLPTFVVRYDRLVETPRQCATEIASFLQGQGIDLDDAGPELETFVDAGLRRSRPGNAGPALPGPEQRELLAALDRLQGPHQALPSVDLPRETEWVDGLLEAERRTGMLDLLRAQRQSERELERSTARRRILGVEVRVPRSSRAWAVLSPLNRLLG